MLATHEQIRDTLKKSKHVLLTCRQDPHVDSVASCLAMYLLLQKFGIPADIVIDAPGHLIEQWTFLPAVVNIKIDGAYLKRLVIRLSHPGAKVGNFLYDVEGDTLNIYITPAVGEFQPSDVKAEFGAPTYDLIVMCDTPDLASLGALYTNHADFFYKTAIINIDHNPANEQYGQINYVDITAVSTSEVLFHLLQEIGDEHLDADIATAILAGMISKTHSFKTPSVTPRSLIVASELVQRGARRDEIIQHLYRQHDLPTLRLWGRVLARLQHDDGRDFVWSMVKRDDFEKSGAGEDRLPGMIDELIATTPSAKIIAVLYERTDGKIGGWLRTEPHTSARELVKDWDPTGSRTLVNFALVATNLEDGLKLVQAKIATLPVVVK